MGLCFCPAMLCLLLSRGIEMIGRNFKLSESLRAQQASRQCKTSYKPEIDEPEHDALLADSRGQFDLVSIPRRGPEIPNPKHGRGER
jgi:hypothetical protein